MIVFTASAVLSMIDDGPRVSNCRGSRVTGYLSQTRANQKLAEFRNWPNQKGKYNIKELLSDYIS